MDCELLSKVYINLIDQKEPSLNFQSEDNNKVNVNLSSGNDYCKSIVKPNIEELKLHKDYLKKSLKKNFFS